MTRFSTPGRFSTAPAMQVSLGHVCGLPLQLPLGTIRPSRISNPAASLQASWSSHLPEKKDSNTCPCSTTEVHSSPQYSSASRELQIHCSTQKVGNKKLSKLEIRNLECTVLRQKLSIALGSPLTLTRPDHPFECKITTSLYRLSSRSTDVQSRMSHQIHPRRRQRPHRSRRVRFLQATEPLLEMFLACEPPQGELAMS